MRPVRAAPAFYVAGGALSPSAASYVERKADEDLLRHLLRGELCYVLTARQMGKSSLMVRTATRLRSAGVHVALIDVAAQGQNVTPEQWYRGLLDEIGEALDLEASLDAHWAELGHLAPGPRWIAVLERAVLPTLTERPDGQPSLVLCFDEIDAIRSLPFPSDEFLLAIRHCVERRGVDPRWRRLTFCLLGVASPAELVRNPEITPFNLGRRIELTDFSLDEALPLAEGFDIRRDAPDARRLLGRVLYWTGGHPYLTQRLCEGIAEVDRSRRVGSREVDVACDSLFFAGGDRPQDSNLLFVRDLLLRSGAGAAGDPELLLLYQRVLSGTHAYQGEIDALTERLRLAGIVTQSRGRLRVRNRIYQHAFDARWVGRHLPDADLRRQRSAFRRGVLRTSLVAGAIVLALGVVASVALDRQWNLERANAALTGSEANLRQTAAELRAESELSERRRRVAVRETERADEAAARAVSSLNTANAALRRETAATAETVRKAREAAQLTQELQIAQVEQQLRQGPALAALPTLVSLLKRADSGDERVAFRACIGSLLQRAAKPAWRKRLFPRLESAWVSPNGRRAVLVRLDHVAHLVDVQSGGAQVTVPLGNSIVGAAFSPDSTRLLTWGAGRAMLRSALTGARLAVTPGGLTVGASVAFTADGDRVLITSDSAAVQVLDGNTLEPTGPPLPYVSKVPIFSISGLTPGGDYYLTDAEGLLTRWNWKTRRRISPMGRQNVVWIAASSNAGRVAALFNDGRLALLDPQTGADRLELATQMDLARIWFTPDGERLVAVERSGRVRTWSGATGEDFYDDRLLPSRAQCAAVFQGGTMAIVGNVAGDIGLWRISTTAPRNPIRQRDADQNILASTEGRIVAAGSGSRTPRIWAADSGSLAPRRVQLPPGDVGAISPDGSKLVYVFGHSDWRVWRAHRGWISPLMRTAQILSAGFSPCGRFLLVCDPNRSTVYDLELDNRPSLLGVLEGRIVGQTHALTSAPGSFMVAMDRGVLLWRKDARGWVGEWTGGEFSWGALSPDGKLYAVGEFGSVTVRDAVTHRPVAGPYARGNTVTRFAFAPDSGSIAIGADDGTLTLVDLEGRRRERVFRSSEAVHQIAFDREGSAIASVGGGGSAWVWDIRTATPLCAPFRTPPVAKQVLFVGGRGLVVTSRRGGMMSRLVPDFRPFPAIEAEVADLMGAARWEPGSRQAPRTIDSASR